jgi:hypothetical protein
MDTYLYVIIVLLCKFEVKKYYPDVHASLIVMMDIKFVESEQSMSRVEV